MSEECSSHDYMYWCTIAYWELRERVGRLFPVMESSVNIFQQLPHGDGMCLRLFQKPTNVEAVWRTREKIGFGIVLSREAAHSSNVNVTIQNNISKEESPSISPPSCPRSSNECDKPDCKLKLGKGCACNIGFSPNGKSTGKSQLTVPECHPMSSSSQHGVNSVNTSKNEDDSMDDSLPVETSTTATSNTFGDDPITRESLSEQSENCTFSNQGKCRDDGHYLHPKYSGHQSNVFVDTSVYCEEDDMLMSIQPSSPSLHSPHSPPLSTSSWMSSSSVSSVSLSPLSSSSMSSPTPLIIPNSDISELETLCNNKTATVSSNSPSCSHPKSEKSQSPLSNQSQSNKKTSEKYVPNCCTQQNGRNTVATVHSPSGKSTSFSSQLVGSQSPVTSPCSSISSPTKTSEQKPHNQQGEVWAYNASNYPIFVNSPTLDDPNSPRSLVVKKVPPGYSIKIFDYARAELLERTEARNILLNDGPYDACSVRISLAKGWGPNYTRQFITSCPCWLEILLGVRHHKTPS